MTIYECLGIDHFLMDEQIPVDFIIENINNESLRNDAAFYFRVIDRVSIRASIARGDHYLQVLEVQLNSPDYIQEISFAIQKAIKYRVFFVFIYKNRYLLVRRSFNLTMSTENVYTYNASFCSDWIYEEYLNLDILYNLPFRTIAEYDEANAEAVELLKTDRDNGDYILFKEFLYLAEWLNRCIVESECISVRWFIDWLKAHIAGQRIELSDFIDRIHEHEACQFIGDYLFIDKSCARTAISELGNESLFTLSMDHTGKQPMSYFDGIGEPATFEEADELSQALQFGSGDYLYLESQANKALKKRRLWDEHQKEFEQKRRKATQRAAADERRRIDDWWIEWERKHLHKQEEPIEDIGTTVIPMNPDVCFENNGDTQNTEDQRFLEEARRKAEEQRCLEEERRKAEEQRRLEEERRKAEEQRRLEEECRKAEEQRRLEEEHQRLEEQHRLEEESRKAEEQRRLEDEQRKVQELRRLEEERRRAEEQRRLEEERHKAEEQHRLEEERRKAEEQHLLEEERRKAEEQYRFEQELVRRKENYRAQNLCQYCGGRFKGFFKKVCSHCGRNKDY